MSVSAGGDSRLDFQQLTVDGREIDLDLLLVAVDVAGDIEAPVVLFDLCQRDPPRIAVDLGSIFVTVDNLFNMIQRSIRFVF